MALMIPSSDWNSSDAKPNLSQIDLQRGLTSGLLEASKILTDIKGIEHLHFSKYDVMRHPLVSKIIERYEEVENDSL